MCTGSCTCVVTWASKKQKKQSNNTTSNAKENKRIARGNQVRRKGGCRGLGGKQGEKEGREGGREGGREREGERPQ